MRNGLWPVLAMLAFASTVGCSTLHTGLSTSLEQQAAEPKGDLREVVVVELRNGKNGHEYLRAPLKENMLVQDALKGSGAISRFRRMDIVLVRETQNGQKVRLPVKYEVAQQQVVDSNNYAMHAGDWLEVTEDTSTILERMIESATEPLRPMMRSPLD
ncbi:MAG: hypothetical protein ACYC3X_03355 [Pirellulaceae bacterium]